MKKLKAFLLALLIIPCLTMLVACGDDNDDGTPKIVSLKAENIVLSQDVFDYDGEEKTPTVTVKLGSSTVSADNYDVVYEDNTEIGTAKVTVSAKESSTVITGSATKEFAIAGAKVSTADEFNAAISAKTKVVYLTSNIGAVNILAYPEDIDVTVYMNGYAITGSVIVENDWNDGDAPAKLSAKFINGTIATEEDEYGLTVIGNSNLSVSLENVTVNGKYAALTTNGIYSGENITAKNCTFGTSTTEAGVYLSAGSTCFFEDCVFNGMTAAFVKGGDITFLNCTLTATGEFANQVPSTNGFNSTGSTLVIESNTAYHDVVVTFFGGALNSTNNKAIEVYVIGTDANHKTVKVNLNKEVELLPERSDGTEDPDFFYSLDTNGISPEIAETDFAYEMDEDTLNKYFPQ